mgnify:CR=1 FL=1
MKVGVVYGGSSPEAKISCKTKDAVVNSLRNLSLDYEEIQLDCNFIKKTKNLLFYCYNLTRV